MFHLLFTSFFVVLIILCFGEPMQSQSLAQQLQAYQANLEELRSAHPNRRDMPDLRFFLFGMGDRRKMIYRDGVLKDALTGEVLRQWTVKNELIVPPAYTVSLETTDGKEIKISEDAQGVWLKEAGKQTALSQRNLNLPDFKGKKYAPILKVLHHEVLINIIDGKPVPNFFVYTKPWFRDATLMGMVLQKGENLRLIKDWVMGIRDPFDRNNHGISEADNLGQVLYLVSLVSDPTHPVVQTVLDSVPQFIKTGEQGTYLENQTDYKLHPVYRLMVRRKFCAWFPSRMLVRVGAL